MAKYERNKGIENDLEAAKVWREAGFAGARRSLGQYRGRSGQDLLEFCTGRAAGATPLSAGEAAGAPEP